MFYKLNMKYTYGDPIWQINFIMLNVCLDSVATQSNRNLFEYHVHCCVCRAYALYLHQTSLFGPSLIKSITHNSIRRECNCIKGLSSFSNTITEAIPIQLDKWLLWHLAFCYYAVATQTKYVLGWKSQTLTFFTLYIFKSYIQNFHNESWQELCCNIIHLPLLQIH